MESVAGSACDFLYGDVGTVAQRIARVTASPNGRSANFSVIGRSGKRSGFRVQLGKVAIVAATSAEYATRAVTGSGGSKIKYFAASRDSSVLASSGR